MPTAPEYTLFLDQSAHLDWDWIQCFEEYYEQAYDGQGVKGLLTQALANLSHFNGSQGRPYYYSICEMGFLRRFVEEDASRGKAILEAGDNFQVIGGGITSPDCLVCSGEGFIRNYLMGRRWLASADGLPGLVPKPHCVIPDDFGQGPELPVLLQALGFTGVVFSRVPGSFEPNVPEPIKELREHGVDFVWEASDGSQAIAHWMLAPLNDVGYGYANPSNPNPPPPQLFTPIETLVAEYRDGAPSGPFTAAATPFMYFPVENDFSVPVDGLLDHIDDWNKNHAPAWNVGARAGTFHDFVCELLQFKSKLAVRRYNGTPYWTGHYASRPELKTLHYATLGALLEAEVFGLLAGGQAPGEFWDGVNAGWDAFAPSTHHDYVTGTAKDATEPGPDVYDGEQLPDLTSAWKTAVGLRDAALAGIAKLAAPSGAIPVVVANGLGFARTDLAELPKGAGGADEAPAAGSTIQPSFEGGALFMASVDSLGFETVDLGASGGSETAATAVAKIEPQTSGAGSYTLANGCMQVTISASAGWGIESLVDAASGEKVLSGTGNELVFYEDGGEIYRFGNETGKTFAPDTRVQVEPSGPGAEVLEAGPLRVRLRTTVTATSADGAQNVFTREYALVAGEPFLRMTTTGAAFPQDEEGGFGFSVMARFPLASPVTSISHGIACHWTDVQPLPGYWDAPVFRATHDFLLPGSAAGSTLAAVYHDGMPAWAFDATGALIGCLLRNTPGDVYGASGSDTDPHTQHYALRVPSGLGPPSGGQPLKEARRFSTPLQVAPIPSGGGGKVPSASVARASDPAILTVAKPGTFDAESLVLRLYQPTNETAEVDVTLGSAAGPVRATVVTALEGAWEGPPMSLRQADAPGFSLTMPAALATVSVRSG